MKQARTGFYSGSFDPITNGHMAILKAALASFERVVVGIGVHASKKGLFGFDERKLLIESSLDGAGLESGRVGIVAFDGLVVHAAREAGAHAIVRGIRDTDDFAYEMQMAGMNAELDDGLPTLFFPASVQTRPISATLVRQIAAMNGDVTSFVPKPVAVALGKINA